MPRRIGLFGGTFDPVHLGHLVLAEQCREQANLDAVWFVPARQPPHKGDKSISAPKYRLEMLNLAISGTSHFALCTIELDRDGPSYTIETLELLTAKYAEDEFSLIIGADMLSDFPNWKEPARISQSCRLIAVNRGRDIERVKSDASLVERDLAARVQIVEMPAIEISSTDLRQRASEGKSVRFLTPRGVEMYIASHRLYSADE